MSIYDLNNDVYSSLVIEFIRQTLTNHFMQLLFIYILNLSAIICLSSKTINQLTIPFILTQKVIIIVPIANVKIHLIEPSLQPPINILQSINKRSSLKSTKLPIRTI